MYHGVAIYRRIVNTMNQDVSLGVVGTITQADIPILRESGRLGEYAVVYRAHRSQLGGGFGDQDKHPFAWAVLVYVDGQLYRIYSARGLAREWSNLDRLERWLRSHGFWYWWTRNDLEVISHEDMPDEEPGGQAIEELPTIPKLPTIK